MTIANDKQRYEFEAVIKELELWYEGDKYKVVCPFHEDINPSMIINKDTACGFCLAESRTYNAADFYKLLFNRENGRDPDDLETLLGLYKLATKYDQNDEYLEAFQTPTLKTGNYTGRSPEELEGYRIKRQDEFDMIPSIKWTKPKEIVEGGRRLRTAEAMKEVIDYMGERGFTPEFMDKMKIKFDVNAPSYRLCIPVFDNGKFMGTVSRTINSKWHEKNRKYLYNKGFSRYNTIMGHYGKESKLKVKNLVVVVEGVFDYMRLRALGMANVVCIFGSSVTEGQAKKLKEAGVKIIVSCFDNDTAGHEAGNKLKVLCNEKGFMFVNYRYPKNGFTDWGDALKLKYGLEMVDEYYQRLCSLCTGARERYRQMLRKAKAKNDKQMLLNSVREFNNTSTFAWSPAQVEYDEKVQDLRDVERVYNRYAQDFEDESVLLACIAGETQDEDIRNEIKERIKRNNNAVKIAQRNMNKKRIEREKFKIMRDNINKNLSEKKVHGMAVKEVMRQNEENPDLWDIEHWKGKKKRLKAENDPIDRVPSMIMQIYDELRTRIMQEGENAWTEFLQYELDLI